MYPMSFSLYELKRLLAYVKTAHTDIHSHIFPDELIDRLEYRISTAEAEQKKIEENSL